MQGDGEGSSSRVVETRWHTVGEEAVALRIEYRPPVILNRWQRMALAVLYGVELAPSRGGRLLSAVLSPFACLFGR